jgi:DNA-binding NarL/FixJ family response regulator
MVAHNVTYGLLIQTPHQRHACSKMFGFARLPSPTCLTASEQQLVSFVAQGYNNQDLAAKLSVSTDLVGAELRGVFSKLGVRSLPALAIYARHSNL